MFTSPLQTYYLGLINGDPNMPDFASVIADNSRDSAES